MISIALFYNEMKCILYFQSPRCLGPHIYASKTIYALFYAYFQFSTTPRHRHGSGVHGHWSVYGLTER